MGPPLISFFAYCIGTPSGQFLRLLYGGPLRSISLLTMWGTPKVNFFAYYMGARSGQFLRLLYGAPPIIFPHIIWGPPQISFFAYYIGAPQACFFAYYMGTPRDEFLCLLHHVRSLRFTIYGSPLILFICYFFYALNYPWGGPHIFEFPGGGGGGGVASTPSCPPPWGHPCILVIMNFIGTSDQ